MITRQNGLGKGKFDKKSAQVQITELKSEFPWPQKARTLTPRQLQRAFGLRMREAALLKFHAADKGAYLAVNWGTKGGRDRVIPIETDYQHGISRKKGITSHSLGHERLNEIYHHITGQLSPVKNQNHQKVNASLDQLARQEIAEVAGHCCPSIASAYVGGQITLRETVSSKN